MNPIIIIGSGLAGYTATREFRKLDGETPLHILSADHGGFYSKPMLSNALAQKKRPMDCRARMPPRWQPSSGPQCIPAPRSPPSTRSTNGCS